jgi:hypothetical protein
MTPSAKTSRLTAGILGTILCLLSAVAVIAAIIFTVTLMGCRQMPILQGRYSEDRVEQARVDSRQTDLIADGAAVTSELGTVLTVVAPEEIAPKAQAAAAKAETVQRRADIEAAKGRERAEQAERDLSVVNASPGPGAWLGGLLGAFSGDFSSIIDLLLGALGIGGAAYGLRGRRKAEQAEAAVGEIADGVERFDECDPIKANELRVHLSRAMDRRSKDLVKAVKARKGKPA